MTFVLLLFALVVVVLAGLMLTTQFLSIFTRAPYVPSSPGAIRAMFELAELKASDRVADLGSGDGRIVVAAARAGAMAEGWESNPLLALWSMLAVKGLGLAGKAMIHPESYGGKDLRCFDSVFLYLLPEEMARLERWLPSAMKPGASVIARAFPFPHWQPEAKKGNVYRYRVPGLMPEETNP